MKIKLLFLFLLFVISASTASAYFLDVRQEARVIGLGDAFVSLADSIDSILVNPAGTVAVGKSTLSVSYVDLYPQLNLRTFDGRDRLNKQLVSVVIPFNHDTQAIGTSYSSFDSKFYQENIFVINYARNFLDRKFLLGTNIKYMQYKINSNGYTTANSSLAGVDLNKSCVNYDLGAVYKINQYDQIGFAVNNLISTDVGLLEKDIIEPHYRLGNTIFLPQFEGQWPNSTSLNVELDYYNHRTFANVGIESSYFNNMLKVRLGRSDNDVDFGFGLSMPIKSLAVSLDYSLSVPIRVQKSVKGHFITINISF